VNQVYTSYNKGNERADIRYVESTTSLYTNP